MFEALRRRIRSAHTDPEQGMTLIEVMVACVILGILSSAILGILLTTVKTTNDDKLRVAAAHLASREIDRASQEFNSGSAEAQAIINTVGTIPTPTNMYPLPSGTVGQPLVVDGVPFTVHRDVEVQALGPGQDACTGQSAAGSAVHPSYSIKVWVTWPNMGLTQPVTNETVVTPSKSFIKASTAGYLAVGVTNAAGDPAANVTVDLASDSGTVVPSQKTDTSGCTVFVLNTPGSYVATLDTANYVDINRNPTPSSPPVTVATGQLASTTFGFYDNAAEIDTTFTTAPGYSLPQTLPDVTLVNTGGTVIEPATAPSMRITSLWPFASGYSVWAGSCAASNADDAANAALWPQGAAVSGPVVVSPGGTAAVDVPLTPVDISIIDDLGDAAPAGTTVTASAANGACVGLDDSTLTLGTTTDDSGHLLTSLPWGDWKVSVGAADSASFSVKDTPTTAEVDLP